jgi:hypothetical protein
MRNLFAIKKQGKRAARVSGPEHWHKETSYPEWWIERSELLLAMLRNAGLFDVAESFSEYGCGPHKPFRSALAKTSSQVTCHALDLKAWDSDVMVADLDSADFDGFPGSCCGVLCGVLEYLQNPASTLARLRSKHKILLFSYCYADLPSARRAEDKVKVLAARAALGWRNHVSIEELASMTGAFGHISDIAHWREQVLVVALRADRV